MRDRQAFDVDNLVASPPLALAIHKKPFEKFKSNPPAGLLVKRMRTKGSKAATAN
jgi:hypothetical protein